MTADIMPPYMLPPYMDQTLAALVMGMTIPGTIGGMTPPMYIPDWTGGYCWWYIDAIAHLVALCRPQLNLTRLEPIILPCKFSIASVAS